jgi:hypothetical protein
MIVYIASYPRSGNFWLQTLLGNQFKRPTTNIHVAVENSDEARSKSIKTIMKWYDIELFDVSVEDLKSYPDELSKWMLGYQIPGVSGDCYFLASGCKDVVKDKKIRKALAEDSQYYFFKTHFEPYPEYLPGEYVVQLVRNPGAVVWSYYNFKQDMPHIEKSDLSTVIQKDVYGNWSEYHEKWLKAANGLGARYYFAQYENLAAGELDFCDNLSGFLQLPVLSRELRSFDHYHRMRPTLTRKGKVSGWEGSYSKEQLRLLWRTHGAMMTKFGYSEPRYGLGMDIAEH